MDPSSYQNHIEAAEAASASNHPSSPETTTKTTKKKNGPKKTNGETKPKPKFPSHNIPQSLLPLTKEELDLLKMYETIRSYETMAERARSDRAVKALEDAAKQYELKLEREREGEEGEGEAGVGVGGDDAVSVNGSDHSGTTTPKKSDLTSSSSMADTTTKKQSNKRQRSYSDASSHESHGSTSIQSDDDDVSPQQHTKKPTTTTTTKIVTEAEKRRQRRREEQQLADNLGTDTSDSSDSDDDSNHRPKRTKNDDGIPLILKKNRGDNNDNNTNEHDIIGGYDSDNPPTTPPPPSSQSLITNLEEQMSTPPTDLSRRLNMTSVSGKNLFPSLEDVERKEMTWSPPDGARDPEDGCMELRLDRFDAARVAVGQGRNTVAIKFKAPTDSKRFSINIASPDHSNYHSVLFHFNPRQFEKGGQLVINNKQDGMWGQGLNIPLSSVPLVFGQPSSTLIVQITGDGFDVFLEGKHCARLEHRCPLPQKAKKLILQMPSTDDRGKKENWIVYKVWWGHKELMAKDISNVAGVNTHDQLHSKKLFISKLPKIRSEAEVDLRRAELERAFRKYGGAHGITATVPTNSTFAFVEVETERDADLALKEMAGRYRLNRARRSRHEALMEKRALEAGRLEASGGVGAAAQSNKEWG